MTYRWVEEEDGWIHRGLRLEGEDRVVYAMVRERHAGGPWHVTWPAYDPEPHDAPEGAMRAAEAMAGLEGEVG